MGTEGANMSYATPHVRMHAHAWCKRTTQDENDTIGEGTTIGLILVLGIISIINSIGIVVYSVVLVVNKQLVLMELPRILIIAGLLLVIGLGSPHFFRKKLRTLTRKKNPWERWSARTPGWRFSFRLVAPQTLNTQFLRHKQPKLCKSDYLALSVIAVATILLFTGFALFYHGLSSTNPRSFLSGSYLVVLGVFLAMAGFLMLVTHIFRGRSMLY